MENNKTKAFLDWIKALSIPPNGKWRGDCYVCGGTNTLLVSDSGGERSYYCFRASCSISGTTKQRLTVEAIELRIGNRTLQKPDTTFDVPDCFVEARTRTEVLEYLAKVNSLEAYLEGRVDIKYDPRQHRVVFMIKKDGEYVGATGRSLYSNTKPKWYIYGNVGCLFNVTGAISNFLEPVLQLDPTNIDPTSTTVLVEDCASCCSVSRSINSAALLGTNLPANYLPSLAKYGLIYVCLDKDASNKAIAIQRQLSYYVDRVEVRFLERDLKYCSKEEIRKILYG